MKRPPLMWSNCAASAATIAGWWFGRLMTAVPSEMFLVCGTRPARNISGEGNGSVVAEKCSPIHSSSKPSRSARIDFVVSSASVSLIERPGGCTGIMNIPRRMRGLSFVGRGHSSLSAVTQSSKEKHHDEGRYRRGLSHARRGHGQRGRQDRERRPAHRADHVQPRRLHVGGQHAERPQARGQDLGRPGPERGDAGGARRGRQGHGLLRRALRAEGRRAASSRRDGAQSERGRADHHAPRRR